MDVLTVVATVSAAVAALAALGALVIAWKTLKEGRETIAELQKLGAAAQAETDAAQQTTSALHIILAEARLAREIDALRGVAIQLSAFVSAMRLVKEGNDLRLANNPGWHEFHDARAVLASQLAAVAPVELPHCAKLADPQTDPRLDNYSDQEQARVEIRKAIERATTRLTEAAHQPLGP